MRTRKTPQERREKGGTVSLPPNAIPDGRERLSPSRMAARNAIRFGGSLALPGTLPIREEPHRIISNECFWSILSFINLNGLRLLAAILQGRNDEQPSKTELLARTGRNDALLRLRTCLPLLFRMLHRL